MAKIMSFELCWIIILKIKTRVSQKFKSRTTLLTVGFTLSPLPWLTLRNATAVTGNKVTFMGVSSISSVVVTVPPGPFLTLSVHGVCGQN